MNHTICLITSRSKPEVGWLIESLHRQKKTSDSINLIVIDNQRDTRADLVGWPEPYYKYWGSIFCRFALPKPTIWSGKHRITSQDWWSASNSRNTGICLCQTEWISFLDDRCVLSDQWLSCVREAIAGNYAMFGSYQKRHGMTVKNGVIEHGGIITAEDSRHDYVKKNADDAAPWKCPGEWSFGCNITLPLEWALLVGGFEEEHCDGLSMEDCIFGLMLQNHELDLRYDHRALMIEDRTPSECGPAMKRIDKGQSPADKSHAALEKLRVLKHTLNRFDITQVRSDIFSGKPWPDPAASQFDWYDNQPIQEL